MKNLQGLELSDFEKRGHIILGKAEVDRTGLGTFVELEDVKDFDISSSLVNLFQKTYALSFGITCLNTNDRYSFFNQGASKYSYVKQGRKIRLYLGIRKKDVEEIITQEGSLGEVQNFDTQEKVESSYTNLFFCSGDYYFFTGSSLWTGRCCNGNDQNTSLLFQNVNIPKGMKIKSAKIYLQASYDHCDVGEIAELKIQAEASDNPTAPTSVEDWQAIQKTTASIVMTFDDGRWPDVYPKEFSYTDDISSIIQEIVDREGWESGNSINILLGPTENTDNGEQLVIDGYSPYGESVPGLTLEIEYQEEIPEIKEEIDVENEYYWNWFYGIIDKASTSFNANNEICSISGRDYIAYLQENFIKNLFWGKSYSTVTIAFKEKYNMPSDCKGIYRAWSNMEGEYKEMSLNSEFTYDWEKNQLVFLYPNVPNENGNLRVQYFTNQKVENVVADLLIESGILGYAEKTSWLNSNYVTATNKTIDRIWFDKGTPYLEAINLLSERAIHRFYVNSEGMPCFRRIPVLLTENAKRMDNSEFETRLVEERVDELYNHFLIEGEKREMKKINLAVNCMAVEALVTERTGEGEEDGESSCILVGYVSADGESSDRWVNDFGGISILSSKGFIWQKIDDDDIGIGAEQKATVSGISRLGLYILPLQYLDFDSRYKWKCWAKNKKGHYAETNWNTFVTPEIPEEEA